MSGGRLAAIRFVGIVVDGEFTDGRFELSAEGVETQAFHTQDGFGARQLLNAGIDDAVISGRKSNAVEKRMAELGVAHILQGCENKVAALDSIIAELGITPAECAYVGDDIPDLPLLAHVGVSVAVANAVPELHDQCDMSTSAAGGFGAVREVCDLVLAAQDRHD